MVLWETQLIADDGRNIYNFISACRGGRGKGGVFQEGRTHRKLQCLMHLKRGGKAGVVLVTGQEGLSALGWSIWWTNSHTAKWLGLCDPQGGDCWSQWRQTGEERVASMVSRAAQRPGLTPAAQPPWPC